MFIKKLIVLVIATVPLLSSSADAHFFIYDQADESSFVFHSIPNHVPFAGENNPIRLFPNPSGYRRLVVYHYDAKLTLTNANGDSSVSKGYFDGTFLWFYNYSSIAGDTKVKVELVNKSDGEVLNYSLNTESVERVADFNYVNSEDVPDNLAELTKFDETNWTFVFWVLLSSAFVVISFVILKNILNKKTNKKSNKKTKSRSK